MEIKVGSVITSKTDPLNNIGIVEEISTHKDGDVDETIVIARQGGWLIARNIKNVIDLTERLSDIV